MKIDQFPASTLHKFRDPATWVAIVVYGFAWTSARFIFVLPDHLSPWMELVIPFLFVTAEVALAPLPWLWTGDDRPQASPLRGLLQAIPWNFFWIAAVIGILFLVDPTSMSRAPDVRLRVFAVGKPLRPEWGLMILNYPLAFVLGLFLADKERAESSERRMKRLADQTRAQVLQAQLNPHVLFNVLSGLTELVHEDPDAAESAIVGLIAMYRELTTHGVALTAPLRSERNLIERYLDIEEIRLGERLETLWEWPAWADPVELPPLLLLPLVENAIKHGITPQPRGGAIRITVAQDGETLILTVANNGVPLEDGARDGTGIGNLKERLRLMTAYAPSLALAQVQGWTVARLTLSWKGRE